MFLSDVSSVKILGRALGAARRVKPSDVDGDGDGFLTGPDGQDNIPAPRVVQDVLRQAGGGSGGVDGGGKKQHAGRRFLDLFDAHEKEMDAKFGDLSDGDNARKAIKQVFPNLREDAWVGDKKKLTPFEKARLSALLRLADNDPKIAKVIHELSWLSDEERQRRTNAAEVVGFKNDDKGNLILVHEIAWNPDLIRPPREIGSKNGPEGSGWGDYIAHEMVKQGASNEEVDKFWAHYVMHHEWTHAEHRVAAFEKTGISWESDGLDFVRKIFKQKGFTDERFDQEVAALIAARKAANPGESDVEARTQVMNDLVLKHRAAVVSMLSEGMNDDLTADELRQLGQGYARGISPYAQLNFAETVAEKASAARLGYELGVNNPPWRKFNSWLYKDKEKPVIDTTGMSRQERRALERELAKQNKKKDAADNFFDIPLKGKRKPPEIRIYGCDGFKHYGVIMGKKSLTDIVSIKLI